MRRDISLGQVEGWAERMRSHLELVADMSLVDAGAGDTDAGKTDAGKEGDPDLRGEVLARFLAAHLPAHGFAVASVHDEDWGWRVQLAPMQLAGSAITFRIGCGQWNEMATNLLCFIEPSGPVIRRWFRRIDIGPVVERLADALQQILAESGKVRELRWRSDDELKAARARAGMVAGWGEDDD